MTRLQFSAYGTTEHAQRLDAVEAIVTQIAPRLGWTPSYRPLRVSSSRGLSGEASSGGPGVRWSKPPATS